MSTKKEIWRLLEPGTDKYQEGDEFWDKVKGSWETTGVRGWSVEGYASIIVRRRMTLPEPQGWISVKERMPTKADANKEGSVFWRDYKNELEQFVVRDWNTRRTLHATHWMSIPPTPEEPKDPDEEAWEEWCKKNLMRNYSVGNAEADAALKEGFMAGRKSVITETEGEA